MRRTEDDFVKDRWTNRFFLLCYVLLGAGALFMVLRNL